MRIRGLAWLGCALLVGGCSSDGDDIECGTGTTEVDDRCVPEGEGSEVVCGEGTHEQDGECVPDGGGVELPHYELRAPVAQVGADGLSMIPILAVGESAGGAPATDEVVISLDRSAGELLEFDGILQPGGAILYFRPCDASQDGCTGPVELSMALAAAPEEPVATLELELVEQTGVYTAAPCLGGGNSMFFDGDGFIYDGLLGVTLGAWSAPSVFDDFVDIDLVPSGQENGSDWSFAFSTLRLGVPLAEGVYEMAEREAFEAEGHPGMDVTGDVRACNTIQGRFQVHEYERVDDSIASFTVSFEQHCDEEEGEIDVLHGCVHYEDQE